MRHLLLLAAFAALAACEPLAPAPPPHPPIAPGPCGADGYAALVGSNFAAVTLPAGLNLRVIRPGDAITMEFNPERLNFELDGRETIIRVYCG